MFPTPTPMRSMSARRCTPQLILPPLDELTSQGQATTAPSSSSPSYPYSSIGTINAPSSTLHTPTSSSHDDTMGGFSSSQQSSRRSSDLSVEDLGAAHAAATAILNAGPNSHSKRHQRSPQPENNNHQSGEDLSSFEEQDALMEDDDMMTDSPNSTMMRRKKARSTGKSSNFRGVSKCMKDGRWQARIRVGKRVKYLGRFKSELEAAKVYDEAAVALHGIHASLNFELSPDEFSRMMATVMEKRSKFGFDREELAHVVYPTSVQAYDNYPTDSVHSSPWGSPRSTAARSTSESLDATEERIAALSLMSLKSST